MHRIAAPTIASEARLAKAPAQADGGGGGGSSSSSSIARPVVMGFRDAFAKQKRAGFGE